MATLGLLQQAQWMCLNLEVNRRDEYRTDACPIPSQNPKATHFPMPFSSLGPLGPFIPKFSE